TPAPSTPALTPWSVDAGAKPTPTARMPPGPRRSVPPKTCYPQGRSGGDHRRQLTMKLSGLLNLRGISGQIAALVIVSIAALHLVITAAFLMHRPEPPTDGRQDELVAAIKLLGTAPPSRRPLLSADLARAFPQLDVENLAPGPPP